MILGYPYYYRYFKCIADKCKDSCCMHWKIDIDDNTLHKYQTWQGSFKKQLTDNIYIDEEGGHFRMDSEERCLFLNPDGLCSLILNIGEENLCDICREHPRFYNSFSFGDEVGIGLCCETAAGLILDDSIPDNIVYISESDTDPENSTAVKSPDSAASVPDFNAAGKAETFQEQDLKHIINVFDVEEDETYLLKDRDVLYKDEDYFSPLWCNVNDSIYPDSFADCLFRRNIISSLSGMLLGLEIISDDWKSRVQRLSELPDTVLSCRENFLKKFPFVKKHCIRLVHYFLFRYYASALYTEDMESEAEIKLLFIQICVGIIILLDTLEWIETGTFTPEQQVQICKLFSQEIEYDEDNVYALEDFACSILPV